MTWPWVQVHGLVAIILLALVLIHDSEANWCAQCDAELSARLDLYAILLIARRCYGGLARSSAGHLRLNIGFCEGHARWAAVDNGSNREAVGFAIAKRLLDKSIGVVAHEPYVVTLKCVPKVDMMEVMWRDPTPKELEEARVWRQLSRKCQTTTMQ